MKRILFQGDSITDALRSRDRDDFPGNGYPTLIKARLGVDLPGKYECMNRAVSGDRVVDLYARMRRDMVKLSPDFISILIGINDVWHEIGSGNGVDAPKFERVYDWLLAELKEALPGVTFVVIEPFVLEGSATCACEERKDRWEYFRTETVKRAEAARRVAEKHHAVFVPMQAAFDAACEKAPASWWLMDGVHPTSHGHELIARGWMEAMKALL